MPFGLFDTLTKQELQKLLRRQKARAQERNDEQWRLAEDFLENKQLARTRAELQRRYPQRQALDKGEQIQAFTLPIADRYVAEAANAYNKSVTRELVDDKGKVKDKPTEALRRMTDEASLDERLHGVERFTVAQDAQPAVVQAKRGRLALQMTPLHRVQPVLPLDASHVDRSDQADYMGHVIEIDTVDKDVRRWVFMTAAAHYYYNSEDWSEFSNIETKPNTAYKWPQRELTEDDKEHTEDHPLQLLAWWHRYIPINKLLPVSDVPIATMNLELNVQLSCILDTLRKQGWSQLVAKVMDPTNPPAAVAMGAGFMLTLGLEEEIVSLSSANDYAGIVDFLKFLVKFFAVLLRQSPNDFAIDASGPQSGFAKLVDSLPKIEARNDRVRRLTAIEENVLWPRMGSVGKYLGELPAGVEKLHMRTKFADVEYPLSVDERAKQEEHDLKHGFTTEAKILAERQGIPLEDAEKQIEENRQKSPQKQPPPPPQSERRTIADMVAKRKGEIKKSDDNNDRVQPGK